MLELQVYTQFHGTWSVHLAIVYSLHQCVVVVGELGIKTEIVGEGEQILARHIDGRALDEIPNRLVVCITEGDIAQLDEVCLIDPTV